MIHKEKIVSELHLSFSEKITKLTNKGYISNTVGDFSHQPTIGVILWANKPIGPGFAINLALSRFLNPNDPIVIIDDELPKATFQRNNSSQHEITKQYVQFFQNHSCRIILGHDIYENPIYDNLFKQLLLLGNHVTISQFMMALPEKKVNSITDLSLIETVHTLSELFLMDCAKNYVDTLIMPQFSQAMLSLHRNISHQPLNGIFTPRFPIEQDRISKILQSFQNETLES